MTTIFIALGIAVATAWLVIAYGPLGAIVFAACAFGYWLLIAAFFKMRDLLQEQTELLKTHTRLLASIANAATPVEPAEQD